MQAKHVQGEGAGPGGSFSQPASSSSIASAKRPALDAWEEDPLGMPREGRRSLHAGSLCSLHSQPVTASDNAVCKAGCWFRRSILAAMANMTQAGLAAFMVSSRHCLDLDFHGVQLFAALMRQSLQRISIELLKSAMVRWWRQQGRVQMQFLSSFTAVDHPCPALSDLQLWPRLPLQERSKWGQ